MRPAAEVRGPEDCELPPPENEGLADGRETDGDRNVEGLDDERDGDDDTEGPLPRNAEPDEGLE